MRDEPFTVHPLLREVYRQTQAVLKGDAWSDLPATLDEIGPILHLDYAMNEGEKRCGAYRVFVRLPGDVIMELIFYPLTGKVGWWWHADNGASGTPGDEFAKTMLWPGHSPMLYAIWRVIELIEQGEEGPCRYRALSLWEMMRKHPEGRGYREFTKTSARTLAKMVRAAPALETVPPIENGAWYAYSRQRPYHEHEREPLEVWVGQAIRLSGGGSPGTPGIAAFLDDMLIVEIADKGRGPATIKRWPGSTLHGLSSTGRSRLFPVKEKFARHLWTFVTPELERSYHVLKRLREGVTNETKEP